MIMKNLIADTIEKIRKEKIQPKARWKFLAKKYSVWISFLAVALAGAAALSVAYFLITQLDWDVFPTAQRRSFLYSFSLLPYFWIVPLVILAIVAYLSLRKTENGYRYAFPKVALAVLGSLFIFGFMMTAIGFGGKINCAAERGFPGYGRLVATKESQWSQPEKGLLAGTINAVAENSIDLKDFAGNDWQVAYAENTDVRPSVKLEAGETIKTIGQEEGDRKFKATEIRPWQGQGQTKKGMGTRNGNAKNSGEFEGAQNSGHR